MLFCLVLTSRKRLLVRAATGKPNKAAELQNPRTSKHNQSASTRLICHAISSMMAPHVPPDDKGY